MKKVYLFVLLALVCVAQTGCFCSLEGIHHYGGGGYYNNGYYDTYPNYNNGYYNNYSPQRMNNPPRRQEYRGDNGYRTTDRRPNNGYRGSNGVRMNQYRGDNGYRGNNGVRQTEHRPNNPPRGGGQPHMQGGPGGVPTHHR